MLRLIMMDSLKSLPSRLYSPEVGKSIIAVAIVDLDHLSQALCAELARASYPSRYPP